MDWKLTCLATILAWSFSVYCMFHPVMHLVAVIILFFASILLFSLGLARIWEEQATSRRVIEGQKKP